MIKMKKVYLVQYKDGDFYEYDIVVEYICATEEKANELAKELFKKVFKRNLKDYQEFESVENIKEFSKPWVREREVIE